MRVKRKKRKKNEGAVLNSCEISDALMAISSIMINYKQVED